MHHEVSTGQHEIDFRYSHALKQPTTQFHSGDSQILAQQKGSMRRSCLSRFGINGAECMFIRAWGTRRTAQMLFRCSDSHGLSKMRNILLPAACSCARNVRGPCSVGEFLQRLVRGFEAPVNICWGRINRSALIRIPRAHTPSSTRIELRCPTQLQPYLAFAVMLAAGLDGSGENCRYPKQRRKRLLGADISKRNAVQRSSQFVGWSRFWIGRGTVILEALAHMCTSASSVLSDWSGRLSHRSDPWELEKYLSIY